MVAPSYSRLVSLQACQLPLFSYIVERLCACCYEQAWYAKLGGVVSIKFLMERLPLTWVLQNQQTFLKALLFVMMDLTGEVGYGCPRGSEVALLVKSCSACRALGLGHSLQLKTLTLGLMIASGRGAAPNSCYLQVLSLVPRFRVDLKGMLPPGHCKGPHRGGIVFLVS